jgi:Bacterial Ig-like domain (group 3)/Domain of unknown function DUF11
MTAAKHLGARGGVRAILLAILCIAGVVALLGLAAAAHADLLNPTTTTTLTVDPNPVGVGAPVTLTATVTGTGGNPPGQVNFAASTGGGPPTVVGTAALVPVPGSSTMSRATLVTGAFAAGTYSVTATYQSSDIFDFFNSTSAPVLLTVSGVDLHQTTTTLAAYPLEPETGHPETLTATVTRNDGSGTPTGVVTFRDNDVLLGTSALDATGVAVLTVDGFIAGDHTITADYSGDAFDRASGATLILSVHGGVGAVSTTTSATATPNPISEGDVVLLSAHVVQAGTGTGVPTGLVLFTTNDVFLGEGSLDATGNVSVAVGGWLVGSYVIKASYLGDVFDLASSAEFRLDVLPAGRADLAVTAAGTTAAFGGDPISDTFTIRNDGPDPTLVSFTAPLPSDLTGAGASASAGTCGVAGGLVTCDLGTLAAGASASVTVTGTISASTAATSLGVTGSVTGSLVDPNAANNSTTAVTSVTPLADLAVTSLSATASVLPGGTITYVAQVANLGPGAGHAVLHDVLPADMTYAGGTAGCSLAAGVVVCDLGTLAPGASASVTIAATLSDSSDATSVSNTVTVSADGNDRNPANDSASATTIVTQLGCPFAGSVHGNEEFATIVDGKKRNVHVETDGDCDLDKKTGLIYLHHARLRVQIDGRPVLIDAKQDKKHSDILRVAISGSDATITGNYAGTPFTVTLHDGGEPNKNDTLRVQYGLLDTSTLSTKHGNVHIDDH